MKKIANITGLNNAFWLVTEDHYEIDIAEVHYPNDIRLRACSPRSQWRSLPGLRT